MHKNPTPNNDRTAHTALAMAPLNNGWIVGRNFAKTVPVAKVSPWDQFNRKAKS